ncbi:MAG: CPBP family intramembrane metalloprotease [Erythrobacter sp.]|nr:CPBP family intramembrane metalloprotease [Erythrobacter sp.]
MFATAMAIRGSMNLMLVTGIMWSPGLAAILTCWILNRPVASLPWQWGEWRWNWYAWFLPIAYGFAIYAPVWVFGLGGSEFGNPETLTSWASQLTGSQEENLGASLLYLVILATIGLVGTASRALGEEIGWRGFMIWEMRKIMPFWAVGLVSGLIWSVWHWPGILLADYNAGEGNFYVQMALFTLAIAPMGVIYAYLTFRSNSLWPAVILHASHNLIIQQVYTPLTIKGAGTQFYIDEFGIMLPIASVVLAVYFYRRAVREGIA